MDNKDNSQKPVNVRIDHDLYQCLVQVRECDGVPVAESIRRAIREYIGKCDRIKELMESNDGK